jgi:hypothetical protein
MMQIDDSGNISGAGGTTDPLHQDQTSQTSQSQIQPSNKPMGFKAHYIAGILIVVAFFAVIAMVLYGSHFVIVTTSIPTTTAPTTTVSPNSNAYLNLTPGSSMSNSLLYGVLNASKYYLLLNSTIDNFSLGADNITSKLAVIRVYGLNFTATLVDSATEFPPSYNLSIPKKYANYTLPITSEIFAYNESSVAEAIKFYNYERKNEIFGENNISLPVYNKTVYYASNFSTSLNQRPGYNYSTVDSEYNIPSSINGLNFTVIAISPFYQNTEWYIIQAQYHNYFIIFNYFGVLNHFNQSSALRIATHYINTKIK